VVVVVVRERKGWKCSYSGKANARLHLPRDKHMRK
jgi:hypothetical protein